MSRLRVLGVPLTLVLAAGCSWNSGPGRSELGSDAFYRPIPGAEDRQQLNPIDQPGAIQRPEDRVQQRVPTAMRQPAGPTTISRAAQAVASTPSTAPSIPANSRLTTAPAGGTTAQYLTLGAVVTDVSGTPIYADKVIHALIPQLSAEAKQRDFESYKALAQEAITQRVRIMIQNELLFAAANRYLTREDKDFANNITMAWRKKQETEAGGSEELARNEGYDFEDQVQQKYRETLVALLFQKKINPQVQVTAEQMRDYYRQHLTTAFTETDQARFRLIKISASKMGSGQEGRDRAIETIKEIREKAVAGSNDDFAKLAKAQNHDSLLMSSGGYVTSDGWLQRGAFAIQPVEDAIWKLQPGEVSDVIQVGDSYYIARLEERKLGRVRPFEDGEVQKEIREAIRQPQLEAKRSQMEEKLLGEATVHPFPPDITPVMEMAIQGYERWKQK